MPWSSSRHPGSTRRSRALRAHVLRTHPTCYLRYPGCTITSTDDEHVIPLSQGGTDDPANHRGACSNCHKIKTQAESRTARRAKHHTPPEPHPGIINRA
jgi:5-methylcytosine-specific restriction protein A